MPCGPGGFSVAVPQPFVSGGVEQEVAAFALCGVARPYGGRATHWWSAGHACSCIRYRAGALHVMSVAGSRPVAR